MSNCTIPGKRHQAEAGLMLCRAHLDEIAEWLHDVEREADILDARPSMAIAWGRSGGTLASHLAPARLDPIVEGDRRYVRPEDVTNPAGFDDTLPVYGVLHDYASLVRDGRLLGVPTYNLTDRVPGTGAGPLCDDCTHRSCLDMRWRRCIPRRLTVVTERTLLIRHLDWIAAQPWAADLWMALQTLRGQLQKANGTAEPGPLPGRCPRLVAGAECGGRLWPVVPKHTSGQLVHAGDEVVQAVECEQNPSHHWEDKALIRLALILDQQQGKIA